MILAHTWHKSLSLISHKKLTVYTETQSLMKHGWSEWKQKEWNIIFYSRTIQK